MNKIVIDACVFAKLFLDEEGFEKVRKYIKEISLNNVQILVPSVFTYEIFYIAQKYNVDLDFVENLLNVYKSFNLEEVNLDNHLIRKSKEMIQKTSNPKSGFPSFYDVSYHILAIENDCDFLTIDKKHEAKTKAFGHIKLLSEI